MSNDHYVPQFYLRNFSPDQKDDGSSTRDGSNIRLINLDRRKFIPSASIKGQCQKAGFHDYKPGLETALSQLEGTAASAIRGIIESDAPPAPRSPDHEVLVAFTTIQRCRTLSAAENSDAMADRLIKVAHEGDPRLRGIDLSEYEIRSQHPVAVPLSAAAQCIPFAMQLGLHVFVNETSEEFITSDDPVVAHNHYCEGIEHLGVLGWDCVGIQILFPVSPRHLVYLYDTKIYAVGTNNDRGTSRIVDIVDVRNLNAFQIVIARKNVYFRNNTMVPSLLSQIERLESQRGHKRNITVQTSPVVDGDGTSELIHQFQRILPLRFSVGSTRIKRSPRRIPLNQRATMVRTPRSSASSRTPGAHSVLSYVARRLYSD